MFKLDINDTLNDQNIQSLTKDVGLQYDITFLSTKLDWLLKKLDLIVNKQGEKCKLKLIIYLFLLLFSSSFEF